jgi:hypothetical protein
MPGVVENDQARRISRSIDDDIKVSQLVQIRAISYPLSQRERELIKKRQKQRKDVKGQLPHPAPFVIF